MARPSPHLCTGESTVVVKVVFTRRRDSFAADERRFSRLRLDHGLPLTIDGSFSLEVKASHDFVTSSRVCSPVIGDCLCKRDVSPMILHSVNSRDCAQPIPRVGLPHYQQVLQQFRFRPV